jgi:glycosyltransferase involved in cell wall biosynthesis
MRIAAVIPTKNRPEDLRKAVESLRDQTRAPEQIVVIDQSDDVRSKEAVTAALSEAPGIELAYVHDPSIAGLVAAKAESLAYTKADIICFFEDDVVLEPDYLREIERGFIDRPAMVGCSGVIANPAKIGVLYRTMYRLFHRGVFTDRRPDVYAQVMDGSREFLPSNIINGGLSAWRVGVFDDVRFDVVNGFHMMEDAEFSARVSQRLPESLYINPNARLAHYPSPINRDGEKRGQFRKIREYALFYRKNHAAPFSGPHFLWLLIGLALDAGMRSVRLRDLYPVTGFVEGLKAGLRQPLR